MLRRAILQSAKTRAISILRSWISSIDFDLPPPFTTPFRPPELNSQPTPHDTGLGASRFAGILSACHSYALSTTSTLQQHASSFLTPCCSCLVECRKGLHTSHSLDHSKLSIFCAYLRSNFYRSSPWSHYKSIPIPIRSRHLQPNFGRHRKEMGSYGTPGASRPVDAIEGPYEGGLE